MCMKEQEYISINHRLDRTFKPDPILQAQKFKSQEDLAPAAIDRSFKDYMIPWYRAETNDKR
jgi:hypothetical protein